MGRVKIKLSLGFTSPHDLIRKAERDLAKLKQAISDQDEGRIGDALYDFSVSVSSMKDWLKAHPAKSYVDADVEKFVSASAALSSFRDLANANKHRVITRYTPKTNEVIVSVLPYTRPSGASIVGKKRFRVKIISADGSRFEASSLGQKAVDEWKAFMTKHGI